MGSLCAPRLNVFLFAKAQREKSKNADNSSGDGQAEKEKCFRDTRLSGTDCCEALTRESESSVLIEGFYFRAHTRLPRTRESF